jgi:argininosuccinate lyase
MSSSSKPVWAKRVGDASINDLVVSYCAGRDVVARPPADEALIPHDLATNRAHATMLGEVGILTQQEAAKLVEALDAVEESWLTGKPLLDPACEDVHMSIEHRVTALVGPELGGRLHTGRSRNDQVATDMALWLRAEVDALAERVLSLIAVLELQSENYRHSPVPGSTHMQPAMITTWGHMLKGYAVRLQRDVEALRAVRHRLRYCPLGSAASFGSSWPTNREITAKLLGFESPSPHTTDAIWSRGENEAAFAFAVAQLLAHLSSIGEDLILLSTPPRKWLRLADEVTTGSSIMPQKRNPDFAEVTRAKAAVVAGHVQAFLGIATAAPNGYNRDTQWTKYLAMDVSEEVRLAPDVFRVVFQTLQVNTEAMLAATQEGFLNATDVADYLARTRRLSFRLCYQILGRSVARCEALGKLTAEVINSELAEKASGVALLTREEMNTLEDPLLLLSLRTQTGSPNPERW